MLMLARDCLMALSMQQTLVHSSLFTSSRASFLDSVHVHLAGLQNGSLHVWYSPDGVPYGIPATDIALESCTCIPSGMACRWEEICLGARTGPQKPHNRVAVKCELSEGHLLAENFSTCALKTCFTIEEQSLVETCILTYNVWPMPSIAAPF